jgi:ABC-2 type transport system permease protein
VLSFFEQWSAAVFRQPALIFAVVLAPFLLLLAFGDAVMLGGPRPRTVIVQTDTSQSIDPILEDIEESVQIVSYTEDLGAARRSLEDGQIDAVAVIPDSPETYLERGEHIPVHVLIGEIDPVARSYARAYLNDQIAELNQRTIEEILTEAKANLEDVEQMTADARQYVELLSSVSTQVGDAREAVGDLRRTLEPVDGIVSSLAQLSAMASIFPGLSGTAEQAFELRDSVRRLTEQVNQLDARLQSAETNDVLPTQSEIQEIRATLDEVDEVSQRISGMDPAVLSSPFSLQLEDLTPSEPSFTAFYSPGVIALLMQHLAITLAALTFSHMRLLRLPDILRVAPIRPSEIIYGNYLSYAVFCAFASILLVVLLVVGLEVPVVGSYAYVVLTLALLIVCSLGVGFIASQLAGSIQQAVQIAMLVLLASIFFAGFTFPLERLDWPARAISYLLPATYAIRTLQDVMLRGIEARPTDILVLAGAALVLLAVNILVLRRSMRPA